MTSTEHKEYVILVDKNNRELGLMEKIEAHQKGLLHRAFSIFIYNDKGQWLLQQRANNKYHSGGLWTNTCCSHPRLGESIIQAGVRRLQEEMGIQTLLTFAFTFIYKARLDKKLIEHELDFVLFGKYNNNPVLNYDEVKNFDWVYPGDIKNNIAKSPQIYTEWFKIVFNRAYTYYLENHQQ